MSESKRRYERYQRYERTHLVKDRNEIKEEEEEEEISRFAAVELERKAAICTRPDLYGGPDGEQGKRRKEKRKKD